MGPNIVLVGMVLNAMPIGEYDKRITLLTKERGKVTAFVRGARRPTSQLLAAASPFSFGEFELYEGRSTYNLTRAVISNYFRELSCDPAKACYGFYFLEVAEYCARENDDATELLGLLYQSLRALSSRSLDARLVRRIYELRILLEEGEYPNLFSCQNCGKKEGLTFFSIERRGTLCSECGEGIKVMPIEESALYAMQRILSSKIKNLYTFSVSEEILFRIAAITDRLFEAQISHKFRSLEILEAIIG